MTTVPNNFVITITGSTIKVMSRYNIDEGAALGRYLSMLLTGTDIPDDVWHAYGLSIEVEPDMDQGVE